MSKSNKIEGIDTDCMTVGRWILQEQRKFPNSTGELTHLLHSIQTACKTISMAVRKAGITKIFGLSGETNTTGDDQKRLDVLSNDLFINMLKSSGSVCMLISEEDEEPHFITDKDQMGKYCVAFDPLDGSSNIECLASIGSIFAIWKKPEEAQTIEQYLVPGRKLEAAGYVLYGSATFLVLALSGRVNGFTLDPSIGEFILTQPNMKIPKKGSIYSLNEGTARSFSPSLNNYLNDIKFPKEKDLQPYKARYVGSMVSDIHRTILYGGIFMYPETKEAPEGKIRLLYESNPIAYIVEQAGGLAITPDENILDLIPTNIHQKCPVYIGSRDDVLKCRSYFNK